MSKLHASIACNLDANILLAALPLFEAEKVQAIEWSFDALFKTREVPPWFTALLSTYSKNNRLVGHGVFFSLFSGKWSPAQQNWLDQLKRLSAVYQFDHITEHFGFMTGANFHQGAPISVPFNPVLLAIGQDRLKRIQEACQAPVGLENLAFAYSIDEVKRHGEFLDQLIAPINGFIILDLHNLYCQIHNFEIDFEDIIQLYPLEQVREIHISGGSWEDSPLIPGKKIRRDTHDDAVPQAVFDLLERTIPRCPNLKYIVLEQIGTGLKTEASKRQFQQDFFKMEQIVQNKQRSTTKDQHTFLPSQPFHLGKPLEDVILHAQQLELSDILETATDYQHAQQCLQASSLANSDWKIETWAPAMVETVLRIAQKWK
ncbi:MAG: hypothetical protein DHS20C18_06260 [Saprospiraceae bacterium]|nr:MAG: hypothetical protein DHS20C18_06260 [Saprospiraceae bacterium]